MPSGVYNRAAARKRGRRLDHSITGGPADVRADVSLRGATVMVDELLQKIILLVRLYPRVTDEIPVTVALMNGHMKEIENAKRVNQPLREIGDSKGEKISAYMRRRWEAARANGNAGRLTAADATAEINPRTGKPFTYSPERRAKMAATQRRLMKDPRARARSRKLIAQAQAARWAGKAKKATKRALTAAELRQRRGAAAAMRAALAEKRAASSKPLRGGANNMQNAASRAKVGNATKKRWALAHRLGWTPRPGVSSPPMAELQALQRARDAASDTPVSQPESLS